MRAEPVFTPNSVILYVSDVKASTGFYRKILGSGPVETYPGFSVFSLSDGMTLGLQAADQIEPAAEPYIGGGELSLSNVESTDFTRNGRPWAFPWSLNQPPSSSVTPLWQPILTVIACACAQPTPRASTDRRHALGR